MMYALVSPSGKIIKHTIGFTRLDCEGSAFHYMRNRLGLSWEARFWKRWKPAQADIRKRGYTISKVKLVLA